MRILSLKRIDRQTAECALEYNGCRYLIAVKLVEDGDIRALQLTGISPHERWEIYNAREGIEFTRQLWKFFDGAALCLPLELSECVKPQH